ncbi:Hypothetical predicted protein [Olea europaea subsp. europaea]|uniref:Uncharacterized protein n=1 Tax=Olea europaea subsp. europaea TaxID=158383 RepID=A0A8S0PV04_OLEEU|nr:Hypothetical predicted protein [Olea europaea subsp. europaea]
MSETAWAVAGMQPDFQTFLGNFWDTAMTGKRPGHGRDVMSRTRQGQSLIVRHFLAIFGTRCASHVRDALWSRQGRSLIFRQFWVVSGTPCAGHVQDAIGTYPDFQVFLGISGIRCAGHVQLAAGTHLDFQVFLRNFLDTVYRQCSGRVGATAGMQPDFQAFVGSFWDTVCRPCSGRGRDADHVQDASWTRCVGNRSSKLNTFLIAPYKFVRLDLLLKDLYKGEGSKLRTSSYECPYLKY